MISAARGKHEDLAARAERSSSPAIVEQLPLQPGGVDPLGLRQVNFGLMDRCLPGLNNAATRLRPYVVVTWAWWKAVQHAQAQGRHVELEAMKSFVDRIEVLFVASHIQAGETGGLLGAQVLGRFLGGGAAYVCVGPAWDAFRRKRSNTSLMAPVAYGPSIKVGAGLGFLRPVDDGMMAPMEEVMPAVMAMDRALAPIMRHRALSELEGHAVGLEDLPDFFACWRVSTPSSAEQLIGRKRLHLDPIADGRRLAIDMILQDLRSSGDLSSPDELRERLSRRTQAEDGTNSGEARTTWRALQVQQLFRYSLEALLVWILRTIGSRPASLRGLRDQLKPHLRCAEAESFGAWLFDAPFDRLPIDPTESPVALIDLISRREWEDPWVGDALDGVRAALRIVRTEGEGSPLFAGQADRLPLRRALQRARLMADLPLDEALEILISEWLIGQHTYWAVSRSGDDTQRLRLLLEEGGWTAALLNPSFPEPTPDRLATVLSLMADSGMILRSPDGRFSYPP